MIWSGEGYLLESMHAKDKDTFTGPHRILSQTGAFTYNITSHLKISRTIPVNLNDIKILHVPCTRNWQLNPRYIPQLLQDLNSSATSASPQIDFLSLNALVLDLLEGKPMALRWMVQTTSQADYCQSGDHEAPRRRGLVHHTWKKSEFQLGKILLSRATGYLNCQCSKNLSPLKLVGGVRVPGFNGRFDLYVFMFYVFTVR